MSDPEHNHPSQDDYYTAPLRKAITAAKAIQADIDAMVPKGLPDKPASKPVQPPWTDEQSLNLIVSLQYVAERNGTQGVPAEAVLSPIDVLGICRGISGALWARYEADRQRLHARIAQLEAQPATPLLALTPERVAALECILYITLMNNRYGQHGTYELNDEALAAVAIVRAMVEEALPPGVVRGSAPLW